jgi:RNA-directed DNA polymerase
VSLSLADLADDDLFERAFVWLCKQRSNHPACSDVWDFRSRWIDEKKRIQNDLRRGCYRFDLLRRIDRGGETLDMWSSRDSLVLKALTLLLSDHLPISPLCVHVKGHGGAKLTMKQIVKATKQLPFVLRTDVRSFYASIDHCLVLDQVARYVPDRGILNLVGQYLTRTAEAGGLYFEHNKGISLGCPLSPLIGALYLKELDDTFADSGLFYRRFMDDVIVLAPSRWKLKRAVRTLNQIFGQLKVDKHPDKTFIGRVARGFDFLGYHVSLTGLRVSAATKARFLERANRLYEQQRRGDNAVTSPLGKYVRRWLGWLRAAGDVEIDMQSIAPYLGPPGFNLLHAEL